MKNEQAVKAAFEYAAERYAAIGVDVNEVLKKMQGISLSLHCWQTDDVSGFENPDGELTGGIQATGNYPGKARNIDEVRADLLKVKSLLPGSHRINLHEVYGDFGGKKVDRDSRYRSLPFDRKYRRQDFLVAVVYARNHVACEPSHSLGFRPRDDYERRHARLGS